MVDLTSMTRVAEKQVRILSRLLQLRGETGKHPTSGNDPTQRYTAIRSGSWFNWRHPWRPLSTSTTEVVSSPQRDAGKNPAGVVFSNRNPAQ